MKRDFEKLYQKPLFQDGRKSENLDDLVSYTVEKLQELEDKLYSKNLDELDCSICGQSSLILDQGRAEQTCRNCGTVIQEKMIEEEIINFNQNN